MTRPYIETDMHYAKRLLLESVPPALTARIVARIHELDLRAARLRAALFGTGALASIAATGGALWYAYSVLMQSAFVDYLSLILTDGGSSTLWRELGLTLLETIPVFETLGVFVALYMLVYTMTRALKNISIITHATKTI